MTRPSTPYRTLLEQIVAADFGAGDPADRARLAALVDADPVAHADHEDIQHLWNTLGALSPTALDPPVAPIADDTNVARLRAGLIARLTSPLGRFAMIGVACCLVLVATLGLLQGTMSAAQAFVIETGKAERRVASLPDGSTVELSGQTRVSVRYSDARRELRLEGGEALVRVATGKLPFVIRAGDGEVHTSGACDIKLVSTGVVVTMIEGDANIILAGDQAARPQSTPLLDGQQLRFGAKTGVAPGSTMTAPRAVSVAGALAWTRGSLEFHGEPLKDVIEEVNRHSAGRVVLLDPAQANTPIYGVLHVGDLDGLASILQDRAKGRVAHAVRIDASPN